MFIIDQTIGDLKIRERNVIRVFFSMNNHQVATPEMMLEETRSYIVFFREAKNKISAYIGLHLLLTDRKLYYVHSSNPFPGEELDAVQEEAISFAEGLGAVLDELDFAQLSPGEANRWIDKQDIFRSTSELRSAAETETPDAVQPPVGQQEPSGPELVPVQAILSQAPLQPQEQPFLPAPVTSSSQELSLQADSKPPPPHPQQGSVSQPARDAQQVPPIQPAPQQASPQTPEVQHPLHAQPAASSPRSQGLAEEESEYRQPYEHGPVVLKRENLHPPQRTMGAGLPGTQAEPPFRPEVPKTPLSADRKGMQEKFQQAISPGFVKGPKQAGKKTSQPAAGFVSRDREALARLLTSF